MTVAIDRRTGMGDFNWSGSFFGTPSFGGSSGGSGFDFSNLFSSSFVSPTPVASPSDVQDFCDPLSPFYDPNRCDALFGGGGAVYYPPVSGGAPAPISQPPSGGNSIWDILSV